MAKININFNNKNYEVDSDSLTNATNDLKQYLSTTMAGSGATISLGGVAYNIDSTKLSTATNNFVSHLGTIAGSGKKVTVNGVEYSVDSNKVSGAISELEAVLGGLNNPDEPTPTEERLEGDGAEFYTLAPTALSFRSTAPLNELNEIQINGVTVDSSNYTLEEGSTIVTFPIEYLKTLNVGNYEVAVASNSKTVKGDFSVKAPELNEYGFYYNQPYAANVDAFGGKTAVFIRNDGTLDLIVTGTGYIETCNYTIADNQLTIAGAMGTFTASPTDNGSSMFVNELYTTFVLGDESIASDEDYIYIYQEDLGGYEVQCIDRTKGEYGAIKTGINGIDTIKLGWGCFVDNTNLVGAPKIPDSVAIIGTNAFAKCPSLASVDISINVTSIDDGAFYGCTSLATIAFNGTIAQWNAITKGTNWNRYVPATYVQCSDGQVAL